MQKGPEYFVEAAAMVLNRTRNIRFVMAGSGDMMNAMIRLAAERGIADRFHFPGFMKGKQVYEVLKMSDVYIMPSVSEPFGFHHWKLCNAAYRRLSLSNPVVPKFYRNVLRRIIGIYMQWQMPFILSVPTILFMNISAMKERKKWIVLYGRKSA